jgi:HK97 family phage prohead protease
MRTKTVPISGVKAGEADGLAEGEFLAYPATFTRQPDSYGDVIAKGAFADSIAEWKSSGDVMPGMYLHDPNQIVAGATDMGEDDHGLWVKGKFDDDPAAQRIYRHLKGRRLSSLSFSYDTADEGKVTLDDGTTANELRRVNAHEFSFLPKGFAANDDTGVVAVKSITDAIVGGLKEGRVLAGKHVSTIKDVIGSLQGIVDAAESDDGGGKSSAEPQLSAPDGAESQNEASAARPANDEDPERGKSEEPSGAASVNRLAAQSRIYALTGAGRGSS